MHKEIKKYYRYLDLPYNATIDDVLTHEKSKIKTLRAKTIKSGKSYKAEIDKVASYSQTVIEYIKTNGVGEQRTMFESNGERIATLAFCLVLVIIMFVASLFAII